MKQSDLPSKLPIPFAASAGASYIRSIPEASQILITPGAASLTDGFPPLNFASSAGYIPPDGKDFNGILNWISSWARWTAAGGLVPYDAAFQTAIGGYPNNAVVLSASSSTIWVSTIDDNMSDPDTGGANWMSFINSGQYTSSKASSGWQKGPDGIIEQWGGGGTSSGSIAVTWPIPFPTAVFDYSFIVGTAGPIGSPGSAAYSGTGSATLTGAYVYSAPGTNVAFRYRVKGY